LRNAAETLQVFDLQHRSGIPNSQNHRFGRYQCHLHCAEFHKLKISAFKNIKTVPGNKNSQFPVVFTFYPAAMIAPFIVV
jgi:hypothetical protein